MDTGSSSAEGANGDSADGVHGGPSIGGRIHITLAKSMTCGTIGLIFQMDITQGKCYYVLAFVTLDIPFDSFNKGCKDKLLAAFCFACWEITGGNASSYEKQIA
jgi:hypothetical protein